MTDTQRAAAMKAFEEWIRTCPDETCLSEAWLACASSKQKRIEELEADNARLREAMGKLNRLDSTDEFSKELRGLINRHSKENGSNTPDFILAHFLNDVMEVLNRAITKREEWYGRSPKPLTDLAATDEKCPHCLGFGGYPMCPICNNTGKRPAESRDQPVHSHDCAIALNARHGCSCGVEHGEENETLL